MKYLLLFIPFQLFGQVWTEKINHDYSGIKRYGDFLINKAFNNGIYPASDTCFLEYTFTGFQLDIYAEQNSKFDYLIVSKNGIDDTVNIKGPLMTERLIYSVTNHSKQETLTVKIRGPIYVFCYFVKYVDSDPFHKPVYEDSIIYNFKDSLVYNYRDTTILNRRDSIIIDYVDSLVYVPDSTLVAVERGKLNIPPCPECNIECNDVSIPSKVYYFFYAILGILVIGFVITLIRWQ